MTGSVCGMFDWHVFASFVGYPVFALYELAPGFFFSSVAIVAVSLVTKNPPATTNL